MPSGIVSSYLGYKGASKAADQQEEAAERSIALQREIYEKQLALSEPYRQIGTDIGLAGLTDLSSQQGQADFYRDYYDSPQYQAQAGQARNQQLAASEATGGLGATSTQNQLARIAPTLGLQALGQQQNLYGNLASIGQTAAGSQAGYAGTYGANVGNLYGELGGIRAGAAALPYQAAAGFYDKTEAAVLNAFGGSRGGGGQF